MNKAFVFSLEAALSLLLLSSLILIQVPVEKKNLSGLLIFQKENDLLKLWAKQGEFSLAKMKKDFEFAFPGMSGKISLNGKKVFIGNASEKAVASQIVFFDSELEKIEVSITVFK